MYRETVKDENIASVNLAANPIAAHSCSVWNFWDVEICLVVILNAEAMGAFENL